MAKKNFKIGLGALIRDTRKHIDDESAQEQAQQPVAETTVVEQAAQNIQPEQVSDDKVKWLYAKMQQLQDELMLWRTGKLNTQLFEQSLSENNLRYNAATNNFEMLQK